MKLDRRSFVRFLSAGLSATGLSSIQRLSPVCAPTKHPQNSPIFVRRRLQRCYNRTTPYLPIAQKCQSHKLRIINEL